MDKLQINFNNILEIMTTAKWENLEGGEESIGEWATCTTKTLK